MATTRHDQSPLFREVEEKLGRVPEWLERMPETAAAGFWAQLRDFHLAETAIPNKYKELIGLGVAGATRCKYCALFHTELARLFGATDEEIAEAAMMAGITMQASTFINADQIEYEQFRDETREIVEYVKRQHAKKQPGGRRDEHARA